MAYSILGSRILMIGKRGKDVELLRNTLEQIPLFSLPPAQKRDWFGKGLEAAVRQMQAYFQEEADGVVGRETYRLFGLEVDEYWPSSLPPLGMRNLRQGMQGRDVLILQNRLGAFRSFYAQMMAKDERGTMGRGTRQALAAFQQEAGIRPSGIFTPAGCFALYRMTGFGNRTLQYGRPGHSCGCDVFFLQERLRKKGYLQQEATGFFDRETEEAVKQLQRENQLVPDGIVQGKTYGALGI